MGKYSVVLAIKVTLKDCDDAQKAVDRARTHLAIEMEENPGLAQIFSVVRIDNHENYGGVERDEFQGFSSPEDTNHDDLQSADDFNIDIVQGRL
jgi:hypothetical protein